jgi:ParB family transcriptional regulator, chromosome partitioning protein
LRAARVKRAEYRAAAQPWTDQGFTLISEWPRRSVAVGISDVRDADGNPVTAEMITDPAHWSVRLTEAEVFADAETGEPVEEEAVDWDTEDDPDAAPEEGLRHANTVVVQTIWHAGYFCHDLAGAGLVDSWAQRQTEKRDEADDEEARRAKEEAEKEKKRAEGRIVRTCNEAARAARVVRRKHVAALLGRKTAPKGAAVFAASILSTLHDLLNDHQAAHTARELLSFKSDKASAEAIGAASEARAQVITLGYVLGALENRMVDDAWRGLPRGTAEYLRFLHEATGYDLAEVEQVVTGERTKQEVTRIS